MSNRIAFVPIRSGSREIPNKNIRNFNGRPLSWWVIRALTDSESINTVVIATDSAYVPFFSRVIEDLGSSKIDLYTRSPKNSRDESTTEDVLLEYIDSQYARPERAYDRLFLAQVTNPFLTTENVDEAIEWMETDMKVNSILSCAPFDKFLWQNKHGRGIPVNYDFHERPLRQWGNNTEYVVENGAFYLNSVANIWTAKNRLSGRVGIYLMPSYTLLEIDTEEDFLRAERIFREEHIR